MRLGVGDWFVLIVVECVPMAAVKMFNAEWVFLRKVGLFANVQQKCKIHPWAKCDWHPDSDAKLKDAAERRNSPHESQVDEKEARVD
jgi:hypothetical protein